MYLNHVKQLFYKDVRLEWRQKYAIGAALLYLIATVFITYLVFDNYITPRVWVALFWIIIIFVAINTTSRSFVPEGQSRYYYYYTLTKPEAIIMGKLLYNNLLMLLMGLTCYGLSVLFLGNFVHNTGLFLLSLVGGCTGLSSLLTMTSAIAWKARNSFSLTAILSFPLTLPFIIVLVQLTHHSLSAGNWLIGLKLLLVLLMLNIIVIILTYILFPYIWKE